MNIILKIAIFLIVNTIGFSAVPFCYILGVRSGALDISDPNFDVAVFQTRFLHSTYLTWTVCAVFSLAFFFLKGKEKYLFLALPVIVPMAYGLSVIFALPLGA
jgi:hypothetical protein